jgi:hypothetical protein
MTMQHQIHPDDERLAALAGGDPELGTDAELRSDAELRAHVSGCDTCRATVDELTILRSALAELPDLVPSRRLQLLPPVAEPRAANAGGWLRRLSAPIMAAGLGLVLVGAVGTSGLLNNFASSAGSAGQVFAPVGNSRGQDALEGAGGAASAEPPRQASPLPASIGPSISGRSLSSQPTAASEDSGASRAPSSSPVAAQKSAVPTDSGRDLQSLADDQPASPWLAVLLAGFVFVVTGGVVRLAVRPN